MHKRRQRKVEAEIGVMRPQRNANSNQKLSSEEGFSPGDSRRSVDLWIP